MIDFTNIYGCIPSGCYSVVITVAHVINSSVLASFMVLYSTLSPGASHFRPLLPLEFLVTKYLLFSLIQRKAHSCPSFRQANLTVDGASEASESRRREQ